ncbi:DUF2935 domain-containing protein [Paenibacillus planticolens]|uniref:DUF2935 domain-containing protein n=1 Tax=Paenibacillus planticolens TaxID=2654976 RepID=A0ABX1ZJ90_9BACL|nr:DUF2935 domain-containing protein [Paenibacillus planticolens]NOU98709.1 DUF2935 domain-containing protein [Paenibacillus planticolens]
MNTYLSSALFEHRFWLQVAGDHARFIKNALTVNEVQEIEMSIRFIHVFDELLNRVHVANEFEGMHKLNHDAYRYAQELRTFKLHLLRRALTGKIGLSLSQAFLNHMINEIEEYLRVLESLLAGQPAPIYNDIHHHLLWLFDASGHAATILGTLDFSEKQLIEKSQVFELHFRDFYLKAVELAGYLRTNLNQFPALARFNKDVEVEMILFRQFLKELEELGIGREALGVLQPLMADHMAREECYYLIKLAQLGVISPISCDPASPRISE